MTAANQRILDLVYAGHPAADVAGLMGVDVDSVIDLVKDTTQVPSVLGGSPALSTPTVVSGTAQQDVTGLPSEVYVAITGGAAGTVKVDVGPTSGVADAIIPNRDATLSQSAHFRLPAGWWFKVTVGGSAAIASAKQLTG